MARSLLLAALLAVSPAARAFAAPADIAMPSAYLVYPPTGTEDVPGNTLVFAADVTAMRLVGPGGEEVAALLDPTYASQSGAAFEPMAVLVPGLHHVLAVPAETAANYSGPDVPVELGTFTVGPTLDEEPILLEFAGAQWAVGSGANDLSVGGNRTGNHPFEPVVYEIDLGDADTAMDDQPDGATAWVAANASTIRLGASRPTIDPDTAVIRLRVIDAAGNVSAWSAPSDVELVQTLDPAPRSCSAVPGTAAAPGAAPALGLGALLLALGRAARRARRT